MDVQRPIESEGYEAKNPHAYLMSIPATDSRWRKVIHFWNLPASDTIQLPISRLRKARSKQVMIAILNDSYCKGNIEITVDHSEKTITFQYRGTVIGEFNQNIMTFIPVHAGIYESSVSTIGQRRSAKFAVIEIVQTVLDNSTGDRISLAYREFLVLLFGYVPQLPSDLWVSRDSYVQAMNAIEEKYKLEVGDVDFLEWRLTLLGRSPKVKDDEIGERK